MEKTPFKFGRSSFAIVIPKTWADKNGIDKRGSVYVEENDSGDLVISSKQGGKTEFEEVVTKETYTFIWRLIGFHYLYGTTKLRIYSKDGFNARQIRAVEENVRRYYMGFEITGQSMNDFVIEDMSNIKEASMDKILAKISFLVSEMFKELLSLDYEKSIGNKHTSFGEEMGEMGVRMAKADDVDKGKSYSSIDSVEELVNRYYLQGIRYLNILRPGNMYLYLRPLELMEDTADWLVRFSKMNFSKVKDILEEEQKLFEASVIAMKGDRKKLDEAFAITETITKKMEKFRENKHMFQMLYDLTWSMAVIGEAGLIREKSLQKPSYTP